MKHYLVIYKTATYMGKPLQEIESKMYAFEDDRDLSDCYNDVYKDLNPVSFENVDIYQGLNDRDESHCVKPWDIFWKTILDMKRVE